MPWAVCWVDISFDEEGLVLTGGKFDPERYQIFKADADGILPVLSDAYFDDDIVTQSSLSNITIKFPTTSPYTMMLARLVSRRFR